MTKIPLSKHNYQLKKDKIFSLKIIQLFFARSFYSYFFFLIIISSTTVCSFGHISLISVTNICPASNLLTYLR